MKPKPSPIEDRQGDLFRVELCRIVDPGHPMVKLARAVDWDRMDEVFGSTFCPDNGRPGVSTRLMVSLLFLKYTHNVSDEQVVAAWTENPYWQVLSGMKWFEHELPIDPSSMTRWRKRIGEAGAEELLKETIQAGLKIDAVKTLQLKRVNVDTTVPSTIRCQGPLHGFGLQKAPWPPGSSVAPPGPKYRAGQATGLRR